MSNSISDISSSRVSNQFMLQQLVRQVNAGQTAMEQLQMQISTGQQFQLPSENPSAAQRVITIQSLLQRKDQLKTNVATNQSYLGATDTALSSASSLIGNIRSAALAVVGSTASDPQRAAVVQQINQAVQQLMTIGNQQFNGRYLFAGSNTGAAPFAAGASGTVQYMGNDRPVSSYSDIGAMFATNVTGAEAFGALSQPIEGRTLAAPVIYDTRLADLNGGAGVSPGSIAISDGHNTSVIDLRNAATIADAAMMIRNNPPQGRTLNVDVTPTGLTINLVPLGGNPPQDNLLVQEVGGNSTAHDLGIFTPTGVGAGPVVGAALHPAITATTPASDILGTRAMANVSIPGPCNDLILDAKSVGSIAADGTVLNGVTVQFVNTAPAAGQESATFVPGNPGTPGTLTVSILAGASRPSQIVAAINNAVGSPFTARLDPTDVNGGSEQVVAALPGSTTTVGGSGVVFDQTHGLLIQSGGTTYTVDISAAKTVEDVLNAINGCGAGMFAQINADRTGIEVQCRTSGVDFSIGENGGTTSTQLGLRTLTDNTQLADLNYGQTRASYSSATLPVQGVGHSTSGPNGIDFTISQPDPAGPPNPPISFSITAGDFSNDPAKGDFAKISTVGQLCDLITQKAQAAGLTTLRAQQATTGNGIELIDDSNTPRPITVTSDPRSTAAVDLGLIAKGQTSNTAASGTLTGTDTNPQETGSVFNALERLATALQSNDNVGIQRAMGLLDGSVQNMNNTRAELGARQQGLTAISSQIDFQEIDLKSALSTDFDTNMAEAISNLTTSQIAYQASLQVAGSTLKMTLLNYL